MRPLLTILGAVAVSCLALITAAWGSENPELRQELERFIGKYEIKSCTSTDGGQPTYAEISLETGKEGYQMRIRGDMNIGDMYWTVRSPGKDEYEHKYKNDIGCEKRKFTTNASLAALDLQENTRWYIGCFIPDNYHYKRQVLLNLTQDGINLLITFNSSSLKTKIFCDFKKL